VQRTENSGWAGRPVSSWECGGFRAPGGSAEPPWGFPAGWREAAGDFGGLEAGADPPGTLTVAPHRGHWTVSPAWPCGVFIVPPQAVQLNRIGSWVATRFRRQRIKPRHTPLGHLTRLPPSWQKARHPAGTVGFIGLPVQGTKGPRRPDGGAPPQDSRHRRSYNRVTRCGHCRL
jgi:hypothetical protein